ncbi:tRNA lysidine(34) synthetase TilS [Planosporangium thailandense]|uniref:tRNA(Ile)-lysidine synthase n=1 Tax=Planosporangium thailandense TaxID=765197 RepID=A0ABX0XTQ7_9ACTN|nr:tRNA lysidine(34) synthetase TilS [Planosporangium thailandense]NJC69183.1 tRNA lysidine(34) synthetase TilS [Planosporangium thailandense]
MAALAPPVAALRVAVRRALACLPSGSLVLVACSGGADSLALAAAAAFVAPRQRLRCGLVTVDHQLQPGSADRAEAVAKWGKTLDLSPVVTTRVEVGGRPGGPEAAAREARYDALIDVARRTGARAILLGHTRDDQAETVLLALARGAGPRGLAAMPARREVSGVLLLRPLLDVPRADTAAACEALGLEPWRDPHNTDPSYARARVRALLPALTEALGPGLVGNLARAASLAAADTAVLDALAADLAAEAADGEGALRVEVLAGRPAALRTRVLHAWARQLGASGSALSARHVDALDALITRWHGQGPVALPGGRRVSRLAGRLVPLPD